MTSDERAPAATGSDPAAEPDSHQSAAVGPAGERVYDAFVLRIWREVGNRRLLRVELEHAQSGDVTNARGVEVDWIGARIAELLAVSPWIGDDPGR